MAGGYTTPQGDQYEILAAKLKALSDRLYELEAPTGTSMNSLVQQVQEAIADIDATVTASIAANSYTKSQIDTKVASPGAIAPTTVTASGAGSFGGGLSTGGAFLNPDSATYNITWTRLTLWVETATGRHGNTASSRRYKTNERPAAIDPLAVLQVAPRIFNYIAEIRKRDDPNYEDYVGPDYVVADEIGLMAEDLHDAGLGHLVYYEDVDGQMLPAAVDYVMWGVTLHVAIRYLHTVIVTMGAGITALRADVAELRATVAALQEGTAS